MRAQVAGDVLIGHVGELGPGQSKKFVLAVAGRTLECFLIHWKGSHYAYVNRCRHIAMSLDWVENRFFDETGGLILCPTHGACYEPDSGECVAGPPFGKRLIRVPLAVRGENIYAAAPADFEDLL